MITISLPNDCHNNRCSLVLTHFCETHGPSVVFTTQTEFILPSTTTSQTDDTSSSTSSSDVTISSTGSLSSTPHIIRRPLVSVNVNHNVNGVGVGDGDRQDDDDEEDNGDAATAAETTIITSLPSLFAATTTNVNNGNGVANGNGIGHGNNNTTDNNTSQQQPHQYTPLHTIYNEHSASRLGATHSVLIPSLSTNSNINNATTSSSSQSSPLLTSSTSSTTSTTSTHSSPTKTTTTTTTTPPARCPTCSSLPQGSGLVSQDALNSNLYYVSTHQPSNTSYSQIRTACVRSLSCELVPGREGPVYISSNDGYFLSYMFKVNDIRARGSARWYGFLFLLGESSSLVNYFSWIVSCFRSMANEMKERSNVVFKREQSTQSSSQALSNLMRRGLRSVPLRPLTELMEDPNFFHRLHSSFSSILSTCNLKYFLLQNQPSMLEEQAAQLQELKERYMYNGGRLGPLRGPQDIHALLAEKLNESVVFPVPQERLRTLGQVYRITSSTNRANDISVLVYNMIVGNQVVIQSRSPALAASLIDLLKELVPRECVSICYYSETFKEIWECNLLGLSPRAIIPRHVDRSVINMVDIDYYDKSQEPEDIDSPYRSTIEITLSGPHHTSTLGLAIESILRQDFPPDVERMHLLTLREEWINKTKSFYGVRSIIENDKDKRLVKFLQLINCGHEKDLTILMFWTACSRKWFTSLERRLSVLK
ncbi:hypothetical protein SAMD00019534_082830 [Acytostelium subglobosum LB1]|uniref:hypothetical protein n=1 Tax=Acytostelium subglobosum LB1 TaxID=1410327 RepID=UPI000644DAD8|nr:hypothetical protein SAMD00019534_082830 [Acytostelium subglobosum LB1]GAM25108.1 hypothetical protein SAMD00019534_082830 [Acytostelium subglobosum LB1]|eukprot:XP_012752197.1 hypothetical protein SAMD00019534_082830 [Acytostelium subglobosum LB1]